MVGSAATMRYRSEDQNRSSTHLFHPSYRRVGDFAILDRDVEVDANKHPLILERAEISDRELVGQRHVVVSDGKAEVVCSFCRGFELREDCLWGVPDRENIDCPCKAGMRNQCKYA
jgi:hypothetical protein